MLTQRILFSVMAGGYACWPATTCYEASPRLSNTHSFANSDNLPLIHETRCISKKVLANAMKMLIRLGSCSSQHDRMQRDPLPSAEVLVCERTIQKQANLKIQKIATIMYHIHIPFVSVLSSFRIPSCCQQTMCLYHCPLPIKRSPQTHTKSMQDSNQSSTELWLPGMDNESSEE
jgi:hypothetical protein